MAPENVPAITPPPSPPPDSVGVSWLCINRETDKVEPFKNWQTQIPWLYTFARVYSKMVPDGTGWKPVRDYAEIWVVDVQAHTVQSITVQSE